MGAETRPSRGAGECGRARRRAALAAGLWIAISAAPPVRAAVVIEVTTPLDEGAPGEVTLRDAVKLANTDGVDTEIHLIPGAVHELAQCGGEPGGEEDLTGVGDLDHTDAHALVLVGEKSEIRQLCPFGRILDHHTGAPLELRGVTLSDALGFGRGGALRSQGPTVLVETAFLRNQVQGTPETPGMVYGGAVAVEASLQIRNSSFRENRALPLSLGWPAGGGAVWGSESVTVEDTTFVGNQADSGGALAALGPVSVRRSSFRDNLAKASEAAGGAIRLGSETAELRVDESEFIENRAIGAGGAIAVGGLWLPSGFSGAQVLLRATAFRNNLAARAGAVYLKNSVGAVLEIERSTFHQNRAFGPAGAVEHGGFYGTLVVRDSTFVANTAEGDGGAVLTGRLGNEATILRSVFQDNRAGLRGGALSVRSGTYLFGPSSLVVSRSVLEGNRAPNGGAIAVWETGSGPGVTFALRDSDLRRNRALRGGGLHLSDSEGFPTLAALVERSSFRSGRALCGAGVLVRPGVELTWRNGTTVSGSAAFGGALYAKGAEAILHHVTALGDAASAGGGVWGGKLLTFRATAIEPAGGAACAGAQVVSEGWNADRDGSCGLAAPGDLPAQGPLPWRQAGPAPGPGPHGYAPAAGSPLIDHLPAASCTLPVDLRGTPRPQGAGCEPGAVEADGLEPAEATPSAAPLDRAGCRGLAEAFGVPDPVALCGPGEGPLGATALDALSELCATDAP